MLQNWTVSMSFVLLLILTWIMDLSLNLQFDVSALKL